MKQVSPVLLAPASQRRSSTSQNAHSHRRSHTLCDGQDVRLLKEAEYLKDEFIGIAAHELRQPLAVLKGMVGTLLFQTARGRGPALAGWQQEMLQDLDLATDRLVHLTDDLLDASRLQAGQLLLHRTATNVVQLSRRLVERFQKTTTLHQLTLHTDTPTVEAFVDPQRVEQVLSNLLANATKYSPQGGSVEITLRLPGDAPEVEIQVQDQGLGIPRHQQGKIFGRFARADNVQAAGIRGTGLGLSLCRALVEQHGGRIWFTSRKGRAQPSFCDCHWSCLFRRSDLHQAQKRGGHWFSVHLEIAQGSAPFLLKGQIAFLGKMIVFHTTAPSLPQRFLCCPNAFARKPPGRWFLFSPRMCCSGS